MSVTGFFIRERWKSPTTIVGSPFFSWSTFAMSSRHWSFCSDAEPVARWVLAKKKRFPEPLCLKTAQTR
jgi:hypothetical protein